MKEDDYTRELECDRGQALWQARLSDGSIVTMDDGRPGMDIPSAWIRLGNYIRESGLSITKLWLKFRSNRLESELPENAEGYFFSKSVGGDLNTQVQSEFYVIGFLRGEDVFVRVFSVPTLILLKTETRAASTINEQLIRNPHCLTGQQTNSMSIT